jgi:hypothetical protein
MSQSIIRTLVFLALIAVPSLVIAQRTVTVTGKVVDRETNKALYPADIIIEGTTYGATTNKHGQFTLKYPHLKPVKLSVSRVGYGAYDIIIDNSKIDDNDSLHVVVSLDFEAVVINTFVMNIKPDTIFGHPELSVEDFEFYEDYYVVLVYEKTLKKGSKVVLTNYKQEVLSSVRIDEEARELFKDFRGNINVICEKGIYRVDVLEEELTLHPRSVADFNYSVKPVLDTISDQYYTTDYHPEYPAITYFAEDVEDDTVAVIRYIENEDLMELYRSEYKYLPPRAKLQAVRLGMKYKIDKEIAAAIISGFAHSIYYKPIYAPLFVVNDTVMIFDHYHDLIFRYDMQNNLIDSVDITYHKQKEREWEELMIVDKETGKVYALFNRNGYTYLKNIETETGEVIKTFKFTYRYADRVHIRGDQVYYVYRPYGSLQKKFMYKENIW